MEELLKKWNVPFGMKKNKEIACLMNNMYAIDKRRLNSNEDEADNYFSGRFFEVTVHSIDKIDITQFYKIGIIIENEKDLKYIENRQEEMILEFNLIVSAISEVKKYYKKKDKIDNGIF